MNALLQAIPFSFAAIFPVLNPIGSAFIFLSLTQGINAQELRWLVFRVSIYTMALLITTLLVGSWILEFFGITIPIVQVGGGLVVAYIGWTLLNQPSTPNTAQDVIEERDVRLSGMAFFPLTMPITAGPGCIAVTLTIGAHNMASTWESTLMMLLGSAIGLTLASGTVYICYRYAYGVTHLLGHSGAQVIIRLAAFINLCIGLEIIWHGLQGLMSQLPH